MFTVANIVGSFPLADFEPAVLALFIPILALMIPIIVVLLKHQQRMAEILHTSNNQVRNPEIEMLRFEVQELKQLVNQQTLAMDTFLDRQRQLTSTTPPATEVHERFAP